MAMKQTQTKLFDFSDVGLDFSNESKAFFPDRFKKMLAIGYNEKTANNASVDGSTITLTYGVAHGYVADRVLQVTADGGFNKEVYIDSVTENTVTCTVLDGITSGLTGVITTKVASLGWEIVYEQANIHVYKMLHIDDTSRYVRLCFTNTSTQGAWRNTISPSVGKSYDDNTGAITDALALQTTKDVMSPVSSFIWAFSHWARSAANANNYASGYYNTGKSWVVGSLYHLVFATGHGGPSESGRKSSKRFAGLLPTAAFDYDSLDYPVLIGESSNPATTGADYQFDFSRAYCGDIAVTFDQSSSKSAIISNRPQATADTTNLDTFNTTTCAPMMMYELDTKQFVGAVMGVYVVKSATNNFITLDFSTVPYLTTDIDLNNKVVVHAMTYSGFASQAVFYAMPIEEVKIA